ncbi:type VI secretion system membrane subunit TssM [Azohydromonas aeria]|uniref:type VI secretion system membrane subunit TssM n=1 Tax=Azohydromonas aeria TaxID=2590212 RepID=UPI0012F8952B|nr:type VI secretion system membrane subunit TssM [Azohydromonas aeria]
MKGFLRKHPVRGALLALAVLALVVSLLAVVAWWPWQPWGVAATGVLAAALLGAVAAGVVRWVRRRRARRASQGLEQAIEGDLARAVRAAQDADPGQREAVAALQQRLQEAIRTLKASHLGRRGSHAALYELPWTLLIGHPGAGKSTAVVQSGLNFPFPHGRDNVLRGIGGTRHCDWFFTSEGILLDTAGRYAVEAEERGEWLSFLGLLRQHRPLAPINGIVVTASVAALRDMGPDALLALARELRARVQELADVLQVCAPVYLLFTKADLVPCFADFFADRAAREREQVWGATLPCRADSAAGDAATQFERHFAALCEGLKEAALARMALQRGQALPAAVLSFPLEFAALQPVLRAFVATLFDENVFQARPLFRGFYFTSAVQPAQDSPAPQRSGVAEQFALAPPARARVAAAEGEAEADAVADAADAPAPAAAPAGQGWFLKDLFSEVIFADRDLVRRHASPARERRRAWSYAGGVLALAGALALWTWSWSGNRQLVAGVQAELDRALRLQQDSAALGARLQALELLQDRIEALEAWRTQRPWSVGLGLYQGDALERRLRQAYFQGLRHVMLEPVAQALQDYLSEVNRRAGPAGDASGTVPGAAPAAATAVEVAAATAPGSPYAAPSAADAEDAYKALKAYLMLADRARMEPGHLTDQVTRFWRGWLEAQRGAASREPLLQSAERVITFAMARLQDPLFPTVANHFGVVDATREQLRRVAQGTPALERVYAEIKARASTRFAPVTVASLVGERDKAVVGGSHVVPGTFTREAWQGYVEGAIRDAARDALTSSDWVLRTSSRDDLSLQGSPQQVRRALTERYQAEYAREWRRFMQGVAVAEFAGLDAAVARMERLADPADSPIRKLLLALWAQTAWDAPTAAQPHAAPAALAGGGIAEWARQSVQRLAPGAPPLPAGDADADAPPVPGAVGREFGALGRLLAPRDGAAALLDGYLQQLGRVRSRLSAIGRQGDAGPGARALMAATFEGPGSELADALRFVEEQLLAGAAEPVREALKPLLVRPLMQCFTALVAPAETELNRQWAAQVLQPFQQSLAGKYPFEPASRVEATPAEIARVFGPGGAVARFAAEGLGPLVTRRGDELSPRQWAQMGLRLRPAFTQGFTGWVGALDGAAGGAGGTGSPGGHAGAPAAAVVSFQLLPLAAAGFTEYTLEIDGQMLQHRGGGTAQWAGFTWPGPGATPGVRLAGVTGDGRSVELFSAPGAYGFERLVEAAAVRKLPDGVRELRWGEGAQAIALQYRAVTSPGPATAGGGRGAAAGLRGLALPALVAGTDAPGPGAATVAAAAASGAAR